MKLLKLNAYILIFCILIYIVHSTKENIQSSKNPQNIEKVKSDLNDSFQKNEEYLKKLENLKTEREIQIKKSQHQSIEQVLLELSESKKPNRSNSPINMKVNYLTNEHLDITKILDTYEKCGKRTGLINLHKNPEKLPAQLDLLPIYGIIDLDKFGFYLNEQAKSLFFTINLIDIMRISQKEQLLSQNCFNIILNHIETETLLKGPLTLCYDSSSKMTDWMKTIQEFKECQIDSTNDKKHNKVLVDFGKVNKLLKDKNDPQKGKDLYYDNTNKVIVKNDANSHKENQIKQIMGTIVETITKGNIQSNLIKRKMSNRLKKTKKASKQLQLKEEMIKNIVNQRIEKENEKKNQLINIEHKNKEIQLLKAVKDRIVEMKKNETKQFNKQLKQQIKYEKQIANQQSRGMINYLIQKTKNSYSVDSETPSQKSSPGKSGSAKYKSTRRIIDPLEAMGLNTVSPLASLGAASYAYDIIKNKKLTPYDNCTDNRILNFADLNYINSTCRIYYGESKEGDCNMKSKFCGMCCSHHVGLAYQNHYKKCFNVCSDLIKGKKNEENGDLNPSTNDKGHVNSEEKTAEKKQENKIGQVEKRKKKKSNKKKIKKN